MKSILVTILMFAAVMGAMQTDIFDIMSGSYMLGIAMVFLITVLFVAFKILGNPFIEQKNSKEKKDGEG